MSVQSTASVNQVLTNFATGYFQEITSPLADFLCPTVQVSGASGQYKTYNDTNAFTIYQTERALGGDGQTITFASGDAYYNCKPNSLNVKIDQYERQLAGPQASSLDQSKVQSLVNAAVISRDYKIVNFVVNNTTAVSGRGNWSNPDIDPIDQLNEQLANLSQIIGGRSNIRMALGIKSFLALSNNPKVKARCSGVQVGNITMSQLNGLLIFPVEIRMGVLSYLDKKAPATGTKSAIIGDNVIITAVSPSPTPYDPSGFKCFATGGGGLMSVNTWTDPSGLFDTHALNWTEDLKLTSTASNIRLAIT